MGVAVGLIEIARAPCCVLSSDAFTSWRITGATMKAVVYRGPHQVAVEDVPDPKIERPTDAIVKITSTNICGSDLHMYEGRTDFEQGRVFGHENLGVVVEVGPAVER